MDFASWKWSPGHSIDVAFSHSPALATTTSPEQETELSLKLLRRIDEIPVEEPTSGSRLLRDKLALEGDVVNPKRIKRLMAILRIKVISAWPLPGGPYPIRWRS